MQLFVVFTINGYHDNNDSRQGCTNNSKNSCSFVDKSSGAGSDDTIIYERNIQNLINWLTKDGAQIRSVAIYQLIPKEPRDEIVDNDSHQNYRGLRFKKPVKNGEKVAEIDFDKVITEKIVNDSPIPSILLKNQYFLQTNIKNYLSPTYHYIMGVFLLEEAEKGHKSRWKPYIDVLPKSYENLPMNFSPSELKQLTGSPILQEIEDTNNKHFKVYIQILKEFPNFDKRFGGYQRFVNFSNHVNNRVFYLPAIYAPNRHPKDSIDTDDNKNGLRLKCKCPNQEVYYVGTKRNKCDQNACIGGTSGPCEEFDKKDKDTIVTDHVYCGVQTLEGSPNGQLVLIP